ncbi:hypothetical protein NPIL_661861 [Nephila pilipes]|uniref:Uncharacterized protein n=1 Tax=Nephila pilipes TaxID=299642 RepID=A0A8X6QSW6_NEPPI|nr:hypothetical protein NPIL_661861 [Nephila pilipes]
MNLTSVRGHLSNDSLHYWTNSIWGLSSSNFAILVERSRLCHQEPLRGPGLYLVEMTPFPFCALQLGCPSTIWKRRQSSKDRRSLKPLFRASRSRTPFRCG